MLNTLARLKFICYHPKCKKLGLTHLVFVDDLLIFTKGNLNSITGVKQVLHLFYVFFGLQVNCSKNELFCVLEFQLQWLMLSGQELVLLLGSIQ